MWWWISIIIVSIFVFISLIVTWIIVARIKKQVSEGTFESKKNTRNEKNTKNKKNEK